MILYNTLYKTQKNKLRLNSKTQIVTKPKNSNCDQSQKLKVWHNSKTQIKKNKIYIYIYIYTT